MGYLRAEAAEEWRTREVNRAEIHNTTDFRVWPALKGILGGERGVNITEQIKEQRERGSNGGLEEDSC